VKEFLLAARAILLDMASMVVFLVAVWLTDNLYWSAAIGMAFGVAQIAWQLIRRQPIEALQWLSLVQALDTRTWSVVMSFWGLGSNIALFLLQYVVMDWIARRRDKAAKTALAGNAV
jgi:hypothetical protein